MPTRYRASTTEQGKTGSACQVTRAGGLGIGVACDTGRGSAPRPSLGRARRSARPMPARRAPAHRPGSRARRVRRRRSNRDGPGRRAPTRRRRPCGRCGTRHPGCRGSAPCRTRPQGPVRRRPASTRPSGRRPQGAGERMIEASSPRQSTGTPMPCQAPRSHTSGPGCRDRDVRSAREECSVSESMAPETNTRKSSASIANERTAMTIGSEVEAALNVLA